MAFIVENKFEIGQIVYLKTDTNQDKFMVTGFLITKYNICYQLQTGNSMESYHYEFEISAEKINVNLINN